MPDPHLLRRRDLLRQRHGVRRDVAKDVIAYRLGKAGFGDGSRISLAEEYQLKPSEDSSHGGSPRCSRPGPGQDPRPRLLRWPAGRAPAASSATTSPGVDVVEFPGAAERMTPSQGRPRPGSRPRWDRLRPRADGRRARARAQARAPARAGADVLAPAAR